MKIVILMIISAIILYTGSQIAVTTSTSVRQTGQFRHKLERLQTLIQISQAVRNAYDMGQTTSSSGQNCPGGTRRITHQGATLCWPASTNNALCINGNNGYFACPVIQGNRPSTSALPQISVNRLFAALKIIPESHAQSYRVFNNRTPRSGQAARPGVRLRAPTCTGGADNPCISCGGGTRCFTMTFCVEDRINTNCAAADRIIQTFAIRE